MDSGVVAKQGAWYSYGETRLGQGRERVRAFLKENKDVCDEIAAETRLALGVDDAPTNGATPVEDAAEEQAAEERAVQG